METTKSQDNNQVKTSYETLLGNFTGRWKSDSQIYNTTLFCNRYYESKI